MKPIYFLSDLHLSRPDDDRTGRVLDFLRARRGEAGAVFLVGDVFDLWLGYRTVIYSAFFPVLRVLAELVEAGTRVVLFAGNHDPDPGAFFAGQLGVEVHEGPLELALDGRRVWVEHGDGVPGIAWRYRLPTRLARTRLARWAARQVHPDRAWLLARRYADVLGHKSGHAPVPAAILERYFPARLAAGADVVIIGHYHRAFAGVASHAGRSGELYVLGDWVRHRTYLRYDGAFALMRDRGPAATPLPLGIGDHDPPKSGAG